MCFKLLVKSVNDEDWQKLDVAKKTSETWIYKYPRNDKLWLRDSRAVGTQPEWLAADPFHLCLTGT